MRTPLGDIFRAHFRPLQPVATGERPVLQKLGRIRAVLFDVYGTLLISASGEVGTARLRKVGLDSDPQRALAGALEAMAIQTSKPVGRQVESLFRAIEASHAELRAAGIDWPEVDIVELWQQFLADLAQGGLIEQAACRAVDPRRLAVEYEARANPCWPMPHLSECIAELRERGLLLGIVSNAQFYTPLLFEALLDQSAEGLGFAPDLQYYSYRHGRAKPGLALYELAVEALRRRGMAPGEALYVGNDMLNDIFPAGKLGFRTALFAGDARSLRRRDGERRLQRIAPDLVLTDLAQLAECIIV